MGNKNKYFINISIVNCYCEYLNIDPNINNLMNKLFLVLTSIALLSVIAMITQLSGQVVSAQQQEQSTPFIVQNTTKSMQDPLPGHESHQIVIAAPPRDDGKIYSGIASFTASQPVEVVMLHVYKPGANSTETGELLNAPFGDGNVAISLMKQFTDSPVNAGSFVFAGNALAFHTLDGKPFVITYTIDADISSLTQ